MYTTTDDISPQMTTVVTVTTGRSLISTVISSITEIEAATLHDLSTQSDNIDTTFVDSTSVSTVTEPYSAGHIESHTLDIGEVTEKTNVLTTPSYHEIEEMNRSPIRKYKTAKESTTTEINVHNITTRADEHYSTLVRNNNNEEYVNTVSDIGSSEVPLSETDSPDRDTSTERIILENDLLRNKTTMVPVESVTDFNKVGKGFLEFDS